MRSHAHPRSKNNQKGCRMTCSYPVRRRHVLHLVFGDIFCCKAKCQAAKILSTGLRSHREMWSTEITKFPAVLARKLYWDKDL